MFSGYVHFSMGAKQVALCLVMQTLISLVIIIQVSGVSLSRRKSLDAIKEVNRKGPYLGLLTVYPPEEQAFFSTGAFKPHPKHPYVDFSGRRFRVGKIHGKKVIYVRCGIGMVNAASVTQQMLDLFDVKGIVHFGIAGNVNDSMSIGDVSIPKQIIHTGMWEWLNANRTLDPMDFAQLDFSSYDVPKGEATNLLGHVGYMNEELFSDSGKINTGRPLWWSHINRKWLQVAQNLEGMELEKCLNSSLCLAQKPKLVVGLRGATANIFLDNAVYRDFLFRTFRVSSADMESQAVVMTCMSNGFPVIVIRGLSDLAGGQGGENQINTFGPLAALNTAKVVVRYVKELTTNDY